MSLVQLSEALSRFALFELIVMHYCLWKEIKTSGETSQRYPLKRASFGLHFDVEAHRWTNMTKSAGSKEVRSIAKNGTEKSSTRAKSVMPNY